MQPNWGACVVAGVLMVWTGAPPTQAGDPPASPFAKGAMAAAAASGSEAHISVQLSDAAAIEEYDATAALPSAPKLVQSAVSMFTGEQQLAHFQARFAAGRQTFLAGVERDGETEWMECDAKGATVGTRAVVTDEDEIAGLKAAAKEIKALAGVEVVEWEQQANAEGEVVRYVGAVTRKGCRYEVTLGADRKLQSLRRLVRAEFAIPVSAIPPAK